MAEEDKNTHGGHRRRMREKLEKFSLTDLPEHEQLEIILYSVIPRGNTNDTAHRLLKKFGSLYGVLTADIAELTKISGVGVRTAEFLHNLPMIVGAVLRSKLDHENKAVHTFNKLENIVKYLTALYADTDIERTFIFYVDKNFSLIKYDKMTEGNGNFVCIDINDAVRRSVVNRAAYVVLSHNHPSENPLPSDADENVTKKLSLALASVNICLWDHVIVAGEKYYSFRGVQNGY